MGSIITASFSSWLPSARHRSLIITLTVFSLVILLVPPSFAKEEAQQKLDAKKEQMQYSQEQRGKLSCSKQARRVHNIKDKQKRRRFIAECRKKREALQRAELENKAKEEKAKKDAEEAILKGEF